MEGWHVDNAPPSLEISIVGADDYTRHSPMPDDDDLNLSQASSAPLTSSALHVPANKRRSASCDGERRKNLYMGGPGVVLCSIDGKGIVVSSVARDAIADGDERNLVTPGDLIESVDGRRCFADTRPCVFMT